MQYPHAYNNEHTPCVQKFHYHYHYLAHSELGVTDAVAQPQYPLAHLVHAESRHPHPLYTPHSHDHAGHSHHHHNAHHNAHHTGHAGHVLHFKKIIATSDSTKVHWVWHITDHGKTVIKTSEHIHSSFEECVRDARHYHTKLVIEHMDIEKTSWAWVITDHHGVLVKKSTTIHATYIKCVEDLHHHHEAY